MAPRAVVRDIDMGYDKITSEIKKFRSKVVLTGFQEETVTKFQVKNGRVKKGGESMASIAAQNEFGAPGVPQRSFMRTAFDENITRIYEVLELQYGLVVDQQITAKQALGEIGEFMIALIKRKITQITFPPNSPVTIALKGSSKPLVDTGQMLNSVTYTIRRQNG